VVGVVHAPSHPLSCKNFNLDLVKTPGPTSKPWRSSSER
jgi:hypothetical protein